MSELRIRLDDRHEARIARCDDRLMINIIDTGEDGFGDARTAIIHLEGVDFRMVREMMMEKLKC